MFTITRPMNGISINSEKETLFSKDGKTLFFSTKEKAIDFAIKAFGLIGIEHSSAVEELNNIAISFEEE